MRKKEESSAAQRFQTHAFLLPQAYDGGFCVSKSRMRGGASTLRPPHPSRFAHHLLPRGEKEEKVAAQGFLAAKPSLPLNSDVNILLKFINNLII